MTMIIIILMLLLLNTNYLTALVLAEGGGNQ